MSNENEVEDVVEVPEVIEIKDEQGNDTTDWKSLALKYNEDAKKNQGIAQRFKTKIEKLKEVKSEAEPIKKKEKKADELDYGQKAYLKASGIDSTEFGFVKEQMEISGKDLDALLQSGYFQTELKAKRDAKVVAIATPGASRGSPEAPSSKVDYWIAKGQLPEEQILREQVVNEKIKRLREARDSR